MNDRGAAVIPGASTGIGEASALRLATRRMPDRVRDKALSTFIGLQKD